MSAIKFSTILFSVIISFLVKVEGVQAAKKSHYKRCVFGMPLGCSVTFSKNQLHFYCKNEKDYVYFYSNLIKLSFSRGDKKVPTTIVFKPDPGGNWKSGACSKNNTKVKAK